MNRAFSIELQAKCFTQAMAWRCTPRVRAAPISPDVVGVLAVGLLGPAPGRMAEDVDAHPPVEVGADRPELAADGLADPLLEVGVPGRAPGHAHREAGGLVDDHAPGPSEKENPGSPETVDPGGAERALVVALLGQVDEAGPERRVAVQAPQLLVLGHHGHDGPGPFAGGGVGGLVRFGGHRASLAAGGLCDSIPRQEASWRPPRCRSASR